MANTAQAKKRVRQAEKARQHNASQRSRFRTYVKKVFAAIQAGDKSQAESVFREAASVIDSTARKGLIHENKAARHKSRLSAHIKAMA
ncbi:30S ribosomal protein S20 [Plasticicumulans acidivorans]|uniref:Small ribosomal subunit protein bS20 n=1 Tax=Plasticicumulans acidivorans TaxID=886464 RepID=A0A317MR91_9GAMM|nr:30S ribosomal protein S20 [Plasticicumulans acidivorans]PWV59305.1 SSU ribosomal protein S20P [Plasticicumulans acidivorans]